MKAIIPAAGIGKRLRPHTFSVPKALLYVAGKPIVAHILEKILALGPSEIILVVGYKGRLVEKYVKEHYRGERIAFVYQQQRRGIAHAVEMTRELAGGKEPLLLLLGDTIVRADFSQLADEEGNVLGVKEVEDPRRFGVCQLADGRVVKLVEKPQIPPGNLALVGLYYIREPELLFACLADQLRGGKTTHGEFQLTDTIQMMIDRGAVFRPYYIEEWFDCGKREALLETNRRLLDEGGGRAVVEGSVVVPPVYIAEDAVVERSIVGPYASIGPGSTVKNSIVRDSVVGEKVLVEASLLEMSIVGSHAAVRGRFQQLNIGESSEVLPAEPES